MTAISLTREKESGTMEALLVSPLRPWEITVGKVTPYLAIGFVSVIAVIVEALLVFHVPLRGSVPLLLLGRNRAAVLHPARHGGRRPDRRRRSISQASGVEYAP